MSSSLTRNVVPPTYYFFSFLSTIAKLDDDRVDVFGIFGQKKSTHDSGIQGSFLRMNSIGHENRECFDVEREPDVSLYITLESLIHVHSSIFFMTRTSTGGSSKTR